MTAAPRGRATISADCLFILRCAKGTERLLDFELESLFERTDDGLFSIAVAENADCLFDWDEGYSSSGRPLIHLRRRSYGSEHGTATDHHDASEPAASTDGLIVTEQADGWCVSFAPGSQFDLFVARTSDGTIFLSDSAAALAVFASGSTLDLEALARRFTGSVTVTDTQTIYRHVHRIAGGVRLTLVDDKLAWRRWWDPAKITIRKDIESHRAADRLRDIAERSVAKWLPRQGGVAVHLSGGRDSSLICALAARQFRSEGRSLLALTALPCAGLPGGDVEFDYDESEGAAATAYCFDNVNHEMLRPVPLPLSSHLDALHQGLRDPIHQPVSLGWSLPMLELCRQRDVTTLLTGDDGNFTVSAGGLPHLSDVWREEGPWQWMRTAACFLRDGVSIRDVGRTSVGAALPRSLYEFLRKPSRPAPLFNDFPFFKGELRHRLRRLTPDNDDPRPSPSHRALIRDVAAHVSALAPVGRRAFGVELLCPWDDRELFEFVLSLPSSLLASAPDRRRLYDAAFSDLLPPEILRPKRRGRQNIDFHAAIDRGDLIEGVERYQSSELCHELINLDQLAGAAADWPKERNTDFRHYAYWVNQFLPALSLASFLYTHELVGTVD